jgi:hypothetical protein
VTQASENPYHPPQPITQFAPARETGISETELAAFAGGKYTALMRPLLEGRARHAGFNVWAALFGVQWFFFRKLYLWGLLSLAADMVLPYLFIGLLRGVFGIDSDSIRAVSVALLFLAGRAGAGYMANIALCAKAERAITEIDRLNKDNDTHLMLIRQAGGVSMPSLLAIYVVLGIWKFV